MSDDPFDGDFDPTPLPPVVADFGESAVVDEAHAPNPWQKRPARTSPADTADTAGDGAPESRVAGGGGVADSGDVVAPTESQAPAGGVSAADGAEAVRSRAKAKRSGRRPKGRDVAAVTPVSFSMELDDRDWLVVEATRRGITQRECVLQLVGETYTGITAQTSGADALGLPTSTRSRRMVATITHRIQMSGIEAAKLNELADERNMNRSEFVCAAIAASRDR